MKKDIHPEYVPARILCGCGNVIETRSTKPEIRVEICSNCHPFFTGQQKFVDTAGRVEKFQRRYGQGKDAVRSKKAKPAAKAEAPAAVAAEK